MRSEVVVGLLLVCACAVEEPLAPAVAPDDASDASAAPDAAIAVVDAGVKEADAAIFEDDATVIEDDAGGAEPIADPSLEGPYGAGVTTVVLEDPSRARTMSVEIWYPIDRASSGGTDNEYVLETAHGVRIAALSSPARRDATPYAGPDFPLVVFSHGYGGIRFQSFFLTEHLATHGFVVAAPDHPGNTLTDFADLGDDGAALQSSIDRPLDVVLVLERMLADRFGLALSINATQIISSGHSFGGWTSLEVARHEPRITAVVSLAPGFREGATPNFVADLARPVAIFGGSVDSTTPFEENQRAPYDFAQRPKLLAKLVGAGHMDFTDLCDVALARLFVNDGCDPQNIDPELVQAHTRTLATAFLKRELLGIAEYEPFLDPAYALALGDLEYWREH